ncbi:MAG: patatin-like protein [Actinomycetota bacterium]|nr:patatin-like protein [Actinomycetota bacterium]
MAPEALPQPREDGEVKELRLALVCYGGVSLAIYMHGMTKELHRLAKASAELDGGVDEAGSSPTERAWREVLTVTTSEPPAGVRPRVVVDVIAGTSAGGINGIYLAKALAHNGSQDGLRDVWFDRGDIRELVRGPKWVPMVLRLAWLIVRGLAPLRGEHMSVWLYGALGKMDRSERAPPVLASLVPEDHELRLFVTITDLSGYNREVPLDHQGQVYDREHRHVLEFRYANGGRDDFSEQANGALAFAARTTSSFPGAFRPVSLRSFSEAIGLPRVDLSLMAGPFFRLYALSGASPSDTWFVDGGVLDNRPFGHAVRAIREQPAATEVDRRLLYLEPDPAEPEANPSGEEPGPIASVLGSVVGVPRKEPIVDDLLEVVAQNKRVRRVREVIESSFDPIATRVEEALGTSLVGLAAEPSGELLGNWRERLNELAIADAGLAYATYSRLKVSGTVDGCAGTVCALLDFPEDSNQALLVRAALHSWAKESGVFDRTVEPSPVQVQFLRDFDLAYAERRLRLVIAGLNWMYEQADDRYPPRSSLDAVKARLYAAIEQLRRVMAGVDLSLEVAELATQCFPEASDALPQNAELEELMEELRSAIAERLQGFDAALYGDLRRLMDGWESTMSAKLLVRYLGFPFWDILLYPVEALSGVGERDHIEVMRLSPQDPVGHKLLTPPESPKLKGLGFHHFGAFFERRYRENDYLWGRLDAAERMVGLLLGTEDHPDRVVLCQKLFSAILDEEESALQTIHPLVRQLRAQVDALGATASSDVT